MPTIARKRFTLNKFNVFYRENFYEQKEIDLRSICRKRDFRRLRRPITANRFFGTGCKREIMVKKYCKTEASNEKVRFTTQIKHESGNEKNFFL